MATREQHKRRAEHDEGFLDVFRQQGLLPKYIDWYITIALNAAVQRFEEMLSVVKPEARGIMGQRRVIEHTGKHEERLRVMMLAFSAAVKKRASRPKTKH